MQIDWGLIWEIVKVLMAIYAGAWINRKFERRARLVVYLGHIAHHKIGDDKEGKQQAVLTWSVVIRNAGKLAAKNVRIKHEEPPTHFNLMPVRPFVKEDLEDGGQDFILDQMVPNEELQISYIRLVTSTASEARMSNRGISSDEGYPQVLDVLPMRQYPFWVRRVLGVLIILGGATAVYLTWELVEWVYKLIKLVSTTG